MIDSALVKEIKGLEELLKYIPQDYSFHDSELEEVCHGETAQNSMKSASLTGHIYLRNGM